MQRELHFLIAVASVAVSLSFFVYYNSPFFNVVLGRARPPEVAVIRKQNYVVFSATIDSFARDADYDFLPPVTALNWYLIAGFQPIIVIVSSSTTSLEKVVRLWDILLPQEISSSSGYIVPIYVPQTSSSAVLVAQVSRLLVASWLPEAKLSGDSFLRVTDADMLIYDSAPFLPPPSGIDIDIFNGRCCLALTPAGERTCRQYPMHSVGMKVELWRKLFPRNVSASNYDGSIVTHILSLANGFGFQSNESMSISHGGKHWYIDQLLLGCTIDETVESGGYNLTLSEGPGARRLHIGGRLLNNTYVDAHLAGFRLASHHKWLHSLVHDTNALSGYVDAYDRYWNAWKLYKTNGSPGNV